MSNKKTTGVENAYPHHTMEDGSLSVDPNRSGLTKREHFAAVALQGILCEYWDPALQRQSESAGSNISKAMAITAVDIADALIEALNQQS